MWTLILSTIITNQVYMGTSTIPASHYSQSDAVVSGFSSMNECYKAGDILKRGFEKGATVKMAFCVEVK